MRYEDLKGKKVLVTGSSSGIGATTAKMFAGQGCFVGVHYFKTEEGGEKTLEEVKKLSDGFLMRADMRDEGHVGKMVTEFCDVAGGIDVLVNNAGTLVGRMDFAEATLEFYEDVFAANTRSTFLATRAAAGYLKESKGNIVNIGSVAGHHGGGAGSGIYAAAKAAVATMTISMAMEFARFGIRVNSVLPGFIDTRFHDEFSTPQRKKAMAYKTPLARNGTAEDVANAICFLASNAASFITGEYIAVNGGLYMRA
jgi:3-oxoacyl-[acyl-carrier protein] reductase